MQNLLVETVSVMLRRGKQVQDVVWVGSADGAYALSWEQFAEIAENVDYDSGYGSAEVYTDLVVVGEDWWLERHEYDGSEWWEYKQRPERQAHTTPFNQVSGRYWPSFAQQGE